MDRNLIDYLPKFLHEFREIPIICKVCQEAVETADDSIMQVLDEAFVKTASKEGIARYERIMGLKVSTEPINDRRAKVLIKMKQRYFYTFRDLQDELNALLGTDGYRIILSNKIYTLEFRISLALKGKLNKTVAYIKQVIPANMVLIADFDYNTHRKLKKFTHAQLAAFTHKYIRNEVM